ncbi:hypothetical protein [Nocardia sp. XZ_19_369]|uniref:hypothetical protein n=1 Tax=Nocardia sp. XZ_19_369 TaxID=2769487 RepID=UPI0018906D6A|nr:hypothetical protein [Nocardia sp. XZ_19_369]
MSHTFTIIGLVTPKQLLIAAVIPGSATVHTPDVNADEPNSRPWHRVISAPSARHAEVAARFLHDHDIALDTVPACALTLNSAVVDMFETTRTVVALRRDDQHILVWFDTDLDFPLDADRPDWTYPLDASVLILPPGVPIPLGT